MSHEGAVTEIVTAENFHTQLGNLSAFLIRPRPLMLLIYTKGCPACEGMKMLQTALAQGPYHTHIAFYLARYDRLKEWEPSLDITVVPTSMFFDGLGSKYTLAGRCRETLKKHLDRLYIVDERLFSKAFNSIFS